MPSAPILRDPAAPDHARVDFIELFFDLVFVFAVTQLSHGLLEHPSIEGALQTAFLTLAVWVVWMWTTWVTGWINPACAPVRLLLLVLMGAGLLMSASIPEAFGERGVTFALAYVFIHLVRTSFTVWALRNAAAALHRNFQRILIWLAVSAVPWVAGGFAEGEARWALWGLGLFIDLGAPWWRFWVPGLGRSSTQDWTVDAGHMAERCGLFVILSLGESVLILGATFSGLEWTGISTAAFLVGFAGSVAMWWVYFATTAEAADEAFHRTRDRGRVARAAYTYAHIPIVAGIILTAVGDELVLAHPTGHADTLTLAALAGGAALFLAGNALFNRMVCGALPVSHLVGLALAAGAGLLGPHVSPLALSGMTAAVLILVGGWETVAPTNRRRAAREAAHAD